MYDKIERRRPTQEEEEAPRSGFYTSPSKKGRGPDMLMGANRFTYEISDSDGHFRAVLKKNREAHEAKIGDRKAFRSTVFTRNAGTTSGGFDVVFTRDDKCLADKPDSLRNVPAKERMEALQLKEEQATMERRPFKPARMHILDSMGYKDAEGNIRNHPPYMPEGERRPGYKKPDLPENLADRRAFKPSSTPTSGPTSSVAKRGIYKANINKFIRRR